MRFACLLLGLLLSVALAAQDDKPAPKKSSAKKAMKKEPGTKQVVHKKPTPEQIRKFNQLEKKQK